MFVPSVNQGIPGFFMDLSLKDFKIAVSSLSQKSMSYTFLRYFLL